jgi:hypothetical protein
MYDKKAELRKCVREHLPKTIEYVNKALSGRGLDQLEPVLRRFERSQEVPHWYYKLRNENVLPNLDGKTIGSVVEKIFVAVIETYIFKDTIIPPLRINPARGVDLPDLDLSVKSPSENFCTSEPFFSAYERLYGSEYDAVVFLTDYQKAKKTPPLRLTIQDSRYLKASEIADRSLCKVARKHRALLLEKNVAWAKKLFRFLAYVNQSDWGAKWIFRITDHIDNDSEILSQIMKAENDFARQNQIRHAQDKPSIPNEDIERIRNIRNVTPLCLGVLDAADNWVIEALKDAGRYPNENEWHRLLNSPLDGKIGMSFALQWRYNFGRLFGQTVDVATAEIEIC